MARTQLTGQIIKDGSVSRADLTVSGSAGNNVITHIAAASAPLGMTQTGSETGTGAVSLSIAEASGSTNGFLSSSNFTTFSNKLNGLITSGGSGSGISSVDLSRTTSSPTANGGIGIKFNYATKVAGMIAGSLSNVGSGTEIGDLILNAAYYNNDPSSRRNFILRAVDATNAEVRIPYRLKIGADSAPAYGLDLASDAMFTSTNRCYFGGTGQYIYSSTSNQLDLFATTTALSGNLSVAGGIITGGGSDRIEIGKSGSDGMIDFIGVGGTNNQTIRFSLDHVNGPKISCDNTLLLSAITIRADGYLTTSSNVSIGTTSSFAAHDLYITNSASTDLTTGIFINPQFTNVSSSSLYAAYATFNMTGTATASRSVFGMYFSSSIISSSVSDNGYDLTSYGCFSTVNFVQGSPAGTGFSAGRTHVGYGGYFGAHIPVYVQSFSSNARIYSLFAQEPSVGTTTGTVVTWSILSQGDLQVCSDKKLILEGDATTKGDSYFVFNSSTTDMNVYVDNTKVWTWDNNLLTAEVPLQISGTNAINFNGTSVQVWRDSGNKLNFKDAENSGGLTLSDLSSGKIVWMEDKTLYHEMINFLSDSNWGVSRAIIKMIKIETGSDNWNLAIMSDDVGYGPTWYEPVKNGSGNKTLILDIPYINNADANQVLVYFEDLDSANDASITIVGVKAR